MQAASDCTSQVARLPGATVSFEFTSERITGLADVSISGHKGGEESEIEPPQCYR